jgi:predicted O-methyltransferase YrrM
MNIEPAQAISEIQANILAKEQDATLYIETNFDARTNVIDFIDFHILDRIESLRQQTGQHEQLNQLTQRAEKLKAELEKINTALFDHLREQIRAGHYALSFKTMVCKYFSGQFLGDDQPDKIGYDNLDVFINGIITDQIIPEPTLKRQPGMVFYQQTPARVIFELAAMAELIQDDIFFDLGSGLGQVGILINLIGGAATIGIEYEPMFCNYARACASNLNLCHVDFINVDAREADYTTGTIFFMYTPFEGSIMQQVLKALQIEAGKRDIKIFTYGPCSSIVNKENWLVCINGTADNIYKLYEFRSTIPS